MSFVLVTWAFGKWHYVKLDGELDSNPWLYQSRWEAQRVLRERNMRYNVFHEPSGIYERGKEILG